MRKLLLTVLVIPLIITMAARDPQGAGHLVAAAITAGAKLLNITATFLSNLLGGNTH